MIDIANILIKLQNNVIKRKYATFVPLSVKKILNTLTDEEVSVLKIEEHLKL